MSSLLLSYLVIRRVFLSNVRLEWRSRRVFLSLSDSNGGLVNLSANKLAGGSRDEVVYSLRTSASDDFYLGRVFAADRSASDGPWGSVFVAA